MAHTNSDKTRRLNSHHAGHTTWSVGSALILLALTGCASIKITATKVDPNVPAAMSAPGALYYLPQTELITEIQLGYVRNGMSPENFWRVAEEPEGSPGDNCRGKKSGRDSALEDLSRARAQHRPENEVQDLKDKLKAALNEYAKPLPHCSSVRPRVEFRPANIYAATTRDPEHAYRLSTSDRFRWFTNISHTIALNEGGELTSSSMSSGSSVPEAIYNTVSTAVKIVDIVDVLGAGDSDADTMDTNFRDAASRRSGLLRTSVPIAPDSRKGIVPTADKGSLADLPLPGMVDKSYQPTCSCESVLNIRSTIQPDKKVLDDVLEAKRTLILALAHAPDKVGNAAFEPVLRALDQEIADARLQLDRKLAFHGVAKIATESWITLRTPTWTPSKTLDGQSSHKVWFLQELASDGALPIASEDAPFWSKVSDTLNGYGFVLRVTRDDKSIPTEVPPPASSGYRYRVPAMARITACIVPPKSMYTDPNNVDWDKLRSCENPQYRVFVGSRLIPQLGSILALDEKFDAESASLGISLYPGTGALRQLSLGKRGYAGPHPGDRE
ncbi:MAG: peptidyl-prolyl cis-trans isomerase [Acidobacteria bacterium]|nr:peptidyl-prolyl cis-trans isomerase [Acidobacteriota bacterium]